MQSGLSCRLRGHRTNSGGEVSLELRGGVRFPDGAVFGLLSEAFVLPAGHETEFDMFSGPVPAEIPLGTYVFEAAILDPTFGIPISRHSIAIVLTP